MIGPGLTFFDPPSSALLLEPLAVSVGMGAGETMEWSKTVGRAVSETGTVVGVEVTLDTTKVGVGAAGPGRVKVLRSCERYMFEAVGCRFESLYDGNQEQRQED